MKPSVETTGLEEKHILQEKIGAREGPEGLRLPWAEAVAAGQGGDLRAPACPDKPSCSPAHLQAARAAKGLRSQICPPAASHTPAPSWTG